MGAVAFPYRIDSFGRTARPSDAEHVRGMVAQVLFTAPGERPNLPEFGCGLQRLAFAPADDVLAAATRFLVLGALDRWLGDVLEVEDVAVAADEGRLVVDVRYTLRATQRPEAHRFVAPGAHGGGVA